MGVAAGAAFAVALLLAGAAVAGLIERWLGRGRAEAGPAGRPPTNVSVAIPSGDPWMYWPAPALALAGVAWGATILPLSESLVGANVNIGLFYFLVVVDFVVLAVAMAGWGANTADAVEACYRVVAQLVAYVVPLGLAVIGPVMAARSLSTVDIVAAQRDAGLWYAVMQPLGLALYLATALMQSYRAPFLEPFAGRIGGGVLGVVGGAPALLWRAALAGLLFIVAAMGAVLFLGGPSGPWLPGPLWMLLKTAAVAGLMVWLGGRLRLRSTAEMLALSWKVLIPVGLLNVLVVGGLILLGVGQEPFR